MKPGHGSFLTLEFGQPSLHVREPREAPGASPRVQRLLSRRHVTVHGEWHLWIYCCAWEVRTDGKRTGHSALDSSSKRPIERAARELDGQRLVRVSVDPAGAVTEFEFDLGSRLTTRPYDAESEKWLLYEPDGHVVTLRADGRYSHQPGSEPRDRERWHPLLTVVPGGFR